MKYTKKKVIVVVAALALLITPTVALANTEQAYDDWKLRLDVMEGRSEMNVYVKEYSPKLGTTCYVATAKSNNYIPESNVSISCLKD